MKAPPRSYPHIGYLDSVRALAALYVVVHHVIFYVWPPWSPAPHHRWATIAIDAFYFGRCAVGVFIVLSGYCLALPVFSGDGSLRGGVSAFLIRRARRILPPYYAALILSAAFVACTGSATTETLWDHSTHLTWLGFFAHFAVVQDWLGRWTNGQFNYVLWSVAVEWHIYFLFPILLLLWKPRSATTTVLGGTAVVLATLVASWYARATVFDYFNFDFVGLFALGMFAAWMVYAVPPRNPKIWFSAACVAVLALLGWMTSQTFSEFMHRLPVADALTGVSTAALLISLGLFPCFGLRQALEQRWLVAIGHFSYSLYLVHALAIHMLWLLAVRMLHLSYTPMALCLVLGGLPFSLVLAYVFYLCFERPFLRRPVAPQENIGQITVPAVSV